ncbi:hypothetical protein GCM10009865_07300 [Aeromicrobium ponti]|uniref:Uncharacterized protein n=1 Tax=Cytobacillus oceanisediminis TaxID=665099 RepID=A0A562K7I8_9BACI|nr:hypothetical protein IQ19_00629 [Cytobacillus oceanisediminis]
MKNNCRFVVNAIGKCGETYHTQCKDKKELQKWLLENQDKLSQNEIKVTDKKKHPLLKLISFNK